jgi:PRC-barrel domain
MDVLVAPEGRVTTLIIGVGGFLGAGEKDVAVPFTAVKHTMKDRKVYLTIDTTKDALKAAPGFKYDRETTTWAPAK